MPRIFDTKEHIILYREERHYATKSSWNGGISKPCSVKAYKVYGSKAPLRKHFDAKKDEWLGTSLEITPDTSQ